MLIRPLQQSDIPKLAAIVNRNYNKHCAEMFYHEAACAFYNYPFVPHFLVIELNSLVIGCACWNADWCSWGVFNISWVQVDPNYQNKGVGKILVDAILNELMPIASLIILATTKPAYYKKWGFEIIKSYPATFEYEKLSEIENLMALKILT
jgi:N-acetylglutamate synthase-like GNAT family acetyltransferase